MKNFILILLFSSFVSFSQEKVFSSGCNWTIIELNDSTYKIQVSNFDSLQAGETCFRAWVNTGQNKPDGVLLIFDEKGVKRKKVTYKNGVRIGVVIEWFPSGEIESKTIWETNNYFTTKAFFKSGRIRFIAENGNRTNAVYKSFYESGQIESIDNSSGSKSWYENGKLKSELNIKSNVYSEWYKNGQLKLKGKLLDAWTRIGKWRYYNEEGKLVRKLIYTKSNYSWYGNEKGFNKEKKYPAN